MFIFINYRSYKNLRKLLWNVKVESGHCYLENVVCFRNHLKHFRWIPIYLAVPMGYYQNKYSEKVNFHKYWNFYHTLQYTGCFTVPPQYSYLQAESRMWQALFRIPLSFQRVRHGKSFRSKFPTAFMITIHLYPNETDLFELFFLDWRKNERKRAVPFRLQ